MPAQRLQLLEVQRLKPEHGLLRLLGHPQQFVDFQMQDVGVAVLRVLDQEHHQERDDGGRGIDDQLPCIVEMKNRSAQPPQENQDQRAHERLGATGPKG
ncbi:hypothetical protein D3C76_812040 [compost metagenome]